MYHIHFCRLGEVLTLLCPWLCAPMFVGLGDRSPVYIALIALQSLRQHEQVLALVKRQAHHVARHVHTTIVTTIHLHHCMFSVLCTNAPRLQTFFITIYRKGVAVTALFWCSHVTYLATENIVDPVWTSFVLYFNQNSLTLYVCLCFRIPENLFKHGPE